MPTVVAKLWCSKLIDAYNQAYPNANAVDLGPCTPLYSPVIQHALSGGQSTMMQIQDEYCSSGSCSTSASTQIGCNDSINVNYAKLGVDGYCYCPVGMLWDSGRNGCTFIKEVEDISLIGGGSCGRKPKVGNPITISDGTKQESVDLGIWLGPARLELTYDSSRLFNVQSSGAGAVPLPAEPPAFGPLWFSSLHKRIAFDGPALPAYSGRVVRGDGRVISFSTPSQSDALNFAPMNPTVKDRLIGQSNGSVYSYTYYDVLAGAVERYNRYGQLQTLTYASGFALTFNYGSDGTLASVMDPFGRTVTFQYGMPDASGLPAGFGFSIFGAQASVVTDPAGQQYLFSYDTKKLNLTQITWPDGRSRSFAYESSTPQLLTGVIDENGSRYSNFGYDSAMRAVSTQHAGGVDNYSVTWPNGGPGLTTATTYDSASNRTLRRTSWSAVTGGTITMPNGTQEQIGLSNVAPGSNFLVSQQQPAASGCAASTNAQSYDANGNVASRDDFNGGRACYVSDLSRNLETARVEGLANTVACAGVTSANATLPASSRKTSTEWHPDWNLAKRVAEPGKLTTNVYNGQPDPFNGNATASCAPSTALLPDGKPIVVLCKSVEQATTDTDGHLGFTSALQSGVANRVQQWTYNQYGQVLTAKDPLNNTTTYAYYSDTSFTGTGPNAVGHTLGDLQTLTNAAGNATSFGQYNKNGQLLQSSDANGVATLSTYDRRGRQLSSSVGGQATSYTYDASGQLTQVTAPDSSWIGYEYDAAHRLTAVKDNLGNRIEYVLDNAGNRTSQDVKDPTGNLARTLARSIDALGRVQQTTGRERGRT